MNVEPDFVNVRGKAYSTAHSVNIIVEIDDGPCKGMKIPIFASKINVAQEFIVAGEEGNKHWEAKLSEPAALSDLKPINVATKDLCVAYSQFCPMHATNLHPARSCRRYMDALRSDIKTKEDINQSRNNREHNQMYKQDLQDHTQAERNAWFDKKFGK